MGLLEEVDRVVEVVRVVWYTKHFKIYHPGRTQ